MDYLQYEMEEKVYNDKGEVLNLIINGLSSILKNYSEIDMFLLF